MLENSSRVKTTVALFRIGLSVAALLFTIGAGTLVQAQGISNGADWTPQQRIPSFHPDTRPPVLVADQNRAVHAFSSQWVGENDSSQLAIMYNQWTLGNGWSEPNDIMLPPLKVQARVLDAFLDDNGMFHVIFFAGDNTEANIYYTSALAVNADRAPAWSTPMVLGKYALAPESGAIAGDKDGNLVAVFASSETGRGYYVTYSADGGDTWLDSTPLLLTYSDQLFPYDIQMHLGQSGLLHAIWNVNDEGDQGRTIYYSNLRMGETQWSEPKKLATVDSGLGTKSPAIMEHDGKVIAVYIVAPQITTRISSDDGNSWTDPIVPFARHVGVNGTVSLVEDSNNDLHLFFGQRITGSPDIHGMWHSVWQENQWSEPEPVVSGPQVDDRVGDQAFDPYDARAVVSQGNILLVTWRSDPGLNGNGVWYSYNVLDAPERPVTPLPAVASGPTRPTRPTPTVIEPTSEPNTRSPLSNQSFDGPVESPPLGSAANILILGITPVTLLLAVILARFFVARQQRR